MKSNKIVKIGIALALTFGLCGCASIVSHSQWPITFSSSPSGAEVTITDASGLEIQKGFTPLTLTLKSGHGYFAPAHYDMEVRMAGYSTAKARLTSSINGWYFGNFFFGGLIGMLIVDPATGAMYTLPPQYGVTLSKENAGNSQRTMKVVSLSSVPMDIRAKLVPVNKAL